MTSFRCLNNQEHDGVWEILPGLLLHLVELLQFRRGIDGPSYYGITKRASESHFAIWPNNTRVNNQRLNQLKRTRRWNQILIKFCLAAGLYVEFSDKTESFMLCCVLTLS